MPAETKPPAGPGPYGAAIDAIVGGRAEQQDAGHVGPLSLSHGRQGLLILVADGMGGHAGGRIAAITATEAFLQGLSVEPLAEIATRLRTGLAAANEALAERAARSPELTGMGCTLVATVLDGELIRWISVGDTLLVAVKDGRIRRLNADHSMGGVLDAQAARGEITAEQARESPQRHMLRSALTGGRIAMIDEGEESLPDRSLLFAASDGILSLSEDALIGLAAKASSPAEFVRSALAEISRDMADDQDNTTIAAALTRRGAGRAAARQARRGLPWRGLLAGVAFLVVIAAVGLVALVVMQRQPAPAAGGGQPIAATPAPQAPTGPLRQRYGERIPALGTLSGGEVAPAPQPGAKPKAGAPSTVAAATVKATPPNGPPPKANERDSLGDFIRTVMPTPPPPPAPPPKPRQKQGPSTD